MLHTVFYLLVDTFALYNVYGCLTYVLISDTSFS